MSLRRIAQLTGPPVVVVILWFGLALVPSALSPHGERRLEIEDERSLLIGELADARALSERVPALEQRLEDTAAAVPPTVELAEFVLATDVAADRTGVAVEQMAPLTVSSDTDDEALLFLPFGTSSVTISVGARGTYPQVVAFADAMQALDRLVVVDLIALNADEEDTSQIILDLEMRIFTTEVLVTTPELEEDLFDEDGELIEEDGEPGDGFDELDDFDESASPSVTGEAG